MGFDRVLTDLLAAPPDAVQVPAADVRRGDQPADRPVPRGRGDVADDVPRPAGGFRSRPASASQTASRAAGPADGTVVARSSPTRSSRRSAGTRCSASSCSTRRSRSRGGAEALRESLHRLRSEAERAVHDGYNVLCISRQGGVQPTGIDPIPSLLALGAVHTYLCQPGPARPLLAGRAGRRRAGGARHRRAWSPSGPTPSTRT